MGFGMKKVGNYRSKADFTLNKSSAFFWGVFFAAVLSAWAVLYVSSPAINGGATFGALDTSFAWASHAKLLWSRVFLMWVLMVLAMMLPTLVPMLSTLIDLTHNRVQKTTMIYGFIFGYMFVWLCFALGATLLQTALSWFGSVSSLGVLVAPFLTFTLLFLAGIYQFSALKQACVKQCQAPLMFFVSNWHDGVRGALRMGFHHGVACLGCCWALMLLGFVGGMMNLIWMGLATVLMTLEKMPSFGIYISPIIGCGLVALSLAYGLHIFLN